VHARAAAAAAALTVALIAVLIVVDAVKRVGQRDVVDVAVLRGCVMRCGVMWVEGALRG
jgi:hypothetical protein